MTQFDDTRRAPNDDVAVSVDGVYKLFGDEEYEALQLARAGLSKDEIQSETGAVLALRDVSFKVARGEIFVVMGLSGCGKSTLVRCINRLIEPTVGEVRIGDREMMQLSDEDLREVRRTEIAMVFQHYGLMPHRSVLENVGWGLEVNGVADHERRDRSVQALAAVGLAEWAGSMPEQLSGGMKQRVGLARALALDAPVLLMDEPFSALDPVIRRDLQDELISLQQELHKTIIFITHDLSEAVRVGDRIAIMRDGGVVQEGAPRDVVLNPADDFVSDFTKDVRLNSMLTASAVMQPPARVERSDVHASVALERLVREHGDDLVVVDEAGRYRGAARLSQLEAAVRGSGGALSELTLYSTQAVSQDAVLDDLVPIGLGADRSLPVVDDDGVLVGEVPLVRLAEAITANDAHSMATPAAVR